jgi:hypothetical protein
VDAIVGNGHQGSSATFHVIAARLPDTASSVLQRVAGFAPEFPLARDRQLLARRLTLLLRRAAAALHYCASMSNDTRETPF